MFARTTNLLVRSLIFMTACLAIAQEEKLDAPPGGGWIMMEALPVHNQLPAGKSVLSNKNQTSDQSFPFESAERGYLPVYIGPEASHCLSVQAYTHQQLSHAWSSVSDSDGSVTHSTYATPEKPLIVSEPYQDYLLLTGPNSSRLDDSGRITECVRDAPRQQRIDLRSLSAAPVERSVIFGDSGSSVRQMVLPRIHGFEPGLFILVEEESNGRRYLLIISPQGQTKVFLDNVHTEPRLFSEGWEEEESWNMYLDERGLTLLSGAAVSELESRKGSVTSVRWESGQIILTPKGERPKILELPFVKKPKVTLFGMGIGWYWVGDDTSAARVATKGIEGEIKKKWGDKEGYETLKALSELCGKLLEHEYTDEDGFHDIRVFMGQAMVQLLVDIDTIQAVQRFFGLTTWLVFSAHNEEREVVLPSSSEYIQRYAEAVIDQLIGFMKDQHGNYKLMSHAFLELFFSIQEVKAQKGQPLGADFMDQTFRTSLKQHPNWKDVVPTEDLVDIGVPITQPQSSSPEPVRQSSPTPSDSESEADESRKLL